MKKERDYLKKLRIQNGYTQQEVADKLGITKATISKYEKGQRRINHITELAQLYGVSEAYIFLGVTEEDLNKKFEVAYEKNLDEERAHWESILLTCELQQISTLLEKLNSEGKNIAIERIRELTEIPRYQQKKEG